MLMIKCYVSKCLFATTIIHKVPVKNLYFLKYFFLTIDDSKAYYISGGEKLFTESLKSTLPKVNYFFCSFHENRYLLPYDKDIYNKLVQLFTCDKLKSKNVKTLSGAKQIWNKIYDK